MNTDMCMLVETTCTYMYIRYVLPRRTSINTEVLFNCFDIGHRWFGYSSMTLVSARFELHCIIKELGALLYAKFHQNAKQTSISARRNGTNRKSTLRKCNK